MRYGKEKATTISAKPFLNREKKLISAPIAAKAPKYGVKAFFLIPLYAPVVVSGRVYVPACSSSFIHSFIPHFL